MPLNVLVVDDSPIIRAVLVRCLKLSGLELGSVSEAGNGRQALERLDAGGIDLLFCDLHMPEMDGIELIHRLHEAGRLVSLPVVIISSDRSQERMDDLARCGIRHYLKKPFTPESVRTATLAIAGAAR